MQPDRFRSLRRSIPPEGVIFGLPDFRSRSISPGPGIATLASAGGAVAPPAQRKGRGQMLIRSWIAASVVLLLAGWARADTLDEIKKRGEMVIGMEAAYVPYESIQDGKIVGFDCDI